jgi:hypothetical protein
MVVSQISMTKPPIAVVVDSLQPPPLVELLVDRLVRIYIQPLGGLPSGQIKHLARVHAHLDLVQVLAAEPAWTVPPVDLRGFSIRGETCVVRVDLGLGRSSVQHHLPSTLRT